MGNAAGTQTAGGGGDGKAKSAPNAHLRKGALEPATKMEASAAEDPATKLYTYTTEYDKPAGEANEVPILPHELVETKDYYYLALEIAGVASLDDVKLTCQVTATGYEVSVEATKSSALDEGGAPAADQIQICTRDVGKVRWHGMMHGVFQEVEPDCCLQQGVLKLRFPKRPKSEVDVEWTEF